MPLSRDIPDPPPALAQTIVSRYSTSPGVVSSRLARALAGRASEHALGHLPLVSEIVGRWIPDGIEQPHYPLVFARPARAPGVPVPQPAESSQPSHERGGAAPHPTQRTSIVENVPGNPARRGTTSRMTSGDTIPTSSPAKPLSALRSVTSTVDEFLRTNDETAVAAQISTLVSNAASTANQLARNAGQTPQLGGAVAPDGRPPAQSSEASPRVLRRWSTGRPTPVALGTSLQSKLGGTTPPAHSQILRRAIGESIQSADILQTVQSRPVANVREPDDEPPTKAAATAQTVEVRSQSPLRALPAALPYGLLETTSHQVRRKPNPSSRGPASTIAVSSDRIGRMQGQPAAIAPFDAPARVLRRVPQPMQEGETSQILRQTTRPSDGATPASDQREQTRSTPAPAVTTMQSATPTDFDIETLKTMIGRLIARDLEIERERRGLGRWR